MYLLCGPEDKRFILWELVFLAVNSFISALITSSTLSFHPPKYPSTPVNDTGPFACCHRKYVHEGCMSQQLYYTGYN